MSVREQQVEDNELKNRLKISRLKNSGAIVWSIQKRAQGLYKAKGETNQDVNTVAQELKHDRINHREILRKTFQKRVTEIKSSIKQDTHRYAQRMPHFRS